MEMRSREVEPRAQTEAKTEEEPEGRRSPIELKGCRDKA